MRGPWALVAGLVLSRVLVAAPTSGNPALEWHDLYDGGVQQSDIGIAALTDAAGNLVIAGESADGIDGIDLVIRKLERHDGASLWSRRIAADDGNDMAVGGMVWDGAGDLLIGGTRLGCLG